MKKDVTEERVFCDFCEQDEVATHRCYVCGKDMCHDKHTLSLDVTLSSRYPGFRAYLCPIHAQPLQPFLRVLAGLPGEWNQIGHNPEYNEARLKETLEFVEHPPVPERMKSKQ